MAASSRAWAWISVPLNYPPKSHPPNPTLSCLQPSCELFSSDEPTLYAITASNLTQLRPSHTRLNDFGPLSQIVDILKPSVVRAHQQGVHWSTQPDKSHSLSTPLVSSHPPDLCGTFQTQPVGSLNLPSVTTPLGGPLDQRQRSQRSVLELNSMYST